jgi:hypothetical protein
VRCLAGGADSNVNSTYVDFSDIVGEVSREKRLSVLADSTVGVPHGEGRQNDAIESCE